MDYGTGFETGPPTTEPIVRPTRYGGVSVGREVMGDTVTLSVSLNTTAEGFMSDDSRVALSMAANAATSILSGC
jgi:hypothetical protein